MSQAYLEDDFFVGKNKINHWYFEYKYKLLKVWLEERIYQKVFDSFPDMKDEIRTLNIQLDIIYEIHISKRRLIDKDFF